MELAAPIELLKDPLAVLPVVALANLPRKPRGVIRLSKPTLLALPFPPFETFPHPTSEKRFPEAAREARTY